MIMRMKNNHLAALLAVSLILIAVQIFQGWGAPPWNQANQVQPKWRDLAYGELGNREMLDIYYSYSRRRVVGRMEIR
jgi:hypothetical protein